MPGIPETPLPIRLDPAAARVQSSRNARLLRVALLGALAVPFLSTSLACFGCGDTDENLSASMPVPDDQACPPSIKAHPGYGYGYGYGDTDTYGDTGEHPGLSEWADDLVFEDGLDPLEFSDCDDFRLTRERDGNCEYEARCWYECIGGRPLITPDGPIVAESAQRSDWRWSLPVADLTDDDRQALAAHWVENALDEHASVASFHVFALELLAHGAPPELVGAAGRAATQEITHAVDCFSLASRYAGKDLGPSTLPLTEASISASLAELAVATLRDGAINETIAAYLAAEALEQATDPQVREALERIVADETAHAELAWQTVAWAMAAGGDDVVRAVRGAFRTARPPTFPDEPGIPAHGLMSGAARSAAARRCFDQVLRPVMATLQARALAA